MSEYSTEKPIAEQMLDWAERLDKRFYLFNKESLYHWLTIKAPRVAELEKFNSGLDAVSLLQDEAVAQLEAKLMAVECGECGKNLLECDFEECDKQASK